MDRNVHCRYNQAYHFIKPFFRCPFDIGRPNQTETQCIGSLFCDKIQTIVSWVSDLLRVRRFILLSSSRSPSKPVSDIQQYEIRFTVVFLLGCCGALIKKKTVVGTKQLKNTSHCSLHEY